MLWSEARGESVLGKRAVAHVALNRVKHPRFPKTLSAVLSQKSQFTFKRGSGKEWNEIQRICSDPGPDPTGGALYFANHKAWPSKQFLCKIDSHYFFK